MLKYLLQATVQMTPVTPSAVRDQPSVKQHCLLFNFKIDTMRNESQQHY